MANWDKKYFVTELRDVVQGAPWSPVFADNEARRVLSLDGEVIKDAFYMETAWFFPGDWPDKTGSRKDRTIGKHVHSYDEVFAWIGTDNKDQYNLNGEIEIWIDGKQNIIDRTFLAFIPAGVEHGPINIRKITKPMFHFSAGMGKKYRDK
ncbi:MAG: hypothetical protein A2Y89_03065 [Chloroflexi bacterium RBG_13_51_18]|nr:MAG: hypothetical protein A2Y89_03065 [Chloroflexi bacterium RBG_13_51_18]